jgi:hypothetical protein
LLDGERPVQLQDVQHPEYCHARRSQDQASAGPVRVTSSGHQGPDSRDANEIDASKVDHYIGPAALESAADSSSQPRGRHQVYFAGHAQDCPRLTGRIPTQLADAANLEVGVIGDDPRWARTGAVPGLTAQGDHGYQAKRQS